MRVLLQRVKHARVCVNGECISSVERGLLALVGFGSMDGLDLVGTKTWKTLLHKTIGLRIFPDAEGKTNLSCSEYAAGVEFSNKVNCQGNLGGILVVSQFTLYADCRKGRRPSFHPAAPPEIADALFTSFTADLKNAYGGYVGTGIFGAEMDVELCNWGPVTILLDSMQMSNSDD